MGQPDESKRPRDRESIVAALRSVLPELRKRYGVQKLALFGSFARGEPTSHSDLDLLVEFDDRPLTLLQFIALEEEMTDLLGIKVDLVEKSALRPRIGQQVLEELIPV
ncbi:MAG: nucleotidyltransferase family protein [Candidatus Bipolaricaulota bacterium]